MNVLLVLLTLSLFTTLSFAGWDAAFRRETDALGHVMRLIRSSYIEEVPAERLLGGAMNGMLKTLDPYSQFLDAKAHEELKAGTKGVFAGIGIEVSVKGGSLHVIAPLDDSPAAKAGIRPGDLLLKIDGLFTKDMALGDAVRKLRGESGSVVTLSLMHEGAKELQEIPLTREVLNVPGVREAKLLENGVGYIRISEFQEHTTSDFKKALDELKAQGMKALIIDVRNNPGGLYKAAVEVAENFVPEGKVIVSTQGRLKEKNRRSISENAHPTVLPLYILVNKGSASGSEILAGAVQDHGLGTLVGSKTYGKGLVQTLTPLADGTAVRITTSRYYTPNGKLIHEVGITPDIAVAASEDAKEKALEHFLAQKA